MPSFEISHSFSKLDFRREAIAAQEEFMSKSTPCWGVGISQADDICVLEQALEVGQPTPPSHDSGEQLRRVGNCQDHNPHDGEAAIRTRILWCLCQEDFPALELAAFLRKKEPSPLHPENHNGKMRRKYAKM